MTTEEKIRDLWMKGCEAAEISYLTGAGWFEIYAALKAMMPSWTDWDGEAKRRRDRMLEDAQ